MSIVRLPRLAGASLVALLLILACSKGDGDGAATDQATEQSLQVGNGTGGVVGDVSGIVAQREAAARRSAAADGRARKRAESAPAMATAPDAMPAPPQAPGQPGTAVPAPPMLIRTGQASLEVDSLEPAIARIQATATRLGGYVANTMIQTGKGELRSAHLELRVPAARFDDAVNAVRPLGKVESFNVGTQDVGEEYVDVAARMANAERLEQRLVTLLATRTGKLEDVLAVERELARVREEIERYEGRLRYLRTQTSFSTLGINIHEPRPVLEPRVGPSPIAGAFRDAWRNFVGFVAAVIASLGVVIPLAAILGLLVWLWRRFGPRPVRVAVAPHTPGGTPGTPPTGERRDAA